MGLVRRVPGLADDEKIRKGLLTDQARADELWRGFLCASAADLAAGWEVLGEGPGDGSWWKGVSTWVH